MRASMSECERVCVCATTRTVDGVGSPRAKFLPPASTFAPPVLGALAGHAAVNAGASYENAPASVPTAPAADTLAAAARGTEGGGAAQRTAVEESQAVARQATVPTEAVAVGSDGARLRPTVVTTAGGEAAAL